MKKPVVALVGRPNVGKSTLFNRIAGKKHAIISPIAGTTRDRLYQDAEWNGVAFTLVDMGGMDIPEGNLPSDERELAEGIQDQVRQALEEADVILFVVDATGQITALDQLVAGVIRRTKKPVLLVANKSDSEHIEHETAQLHRLGIGSPHPVSAVQGRGIADLLDLLVAIPEIAHSADRVNTVAESDITVAIVGRPNVGKSSLINALLGEPRVLVSPVAGTTRDTTDLSLTHGDKKIIFTDTAGLRRRSKLEPQSIEQYSVMRALGAVARSDIAVLMLDVSTDIAHQDLMIAAAVEKAKKGLIILVNKWDLAEKKTDSMSKYTKYLRRMFDQCTWAPVIFVSAKTGQRVEQVLEMVVRVSAAQHTRLSPEQLQAFVRRMELKHGPGFAPGFGSVRLTGAVQTGVNPPVIAIYTNAPSGIRYEYRRFLEKQLRETFGFEGTYIQIVMRKKKSRKR